MAEPTAAGGYPNGCFFMLAVLLCAIKDKGRRELFMASFTNKPSVFTYSVDMDFAASFMEIDSLSALTPFTQRLRRDGQAQQQQQQWGILGRMLLQCSSWCECSDHGVVSLCSEERVEL